MIREQDAHAICLGRVVVALRKKAGLTQGDLAGRVGLLQPTMSRLELGKTTPDTWTWAKLQQELGEADHLVWQVHKRACDLLRDITEQEAPWDLTRETLAGLADLIIGVSLARPKP